MTKAFARFSFAAALAAMSVMSVSSAHATGEIVSLITKADEARLEKFDAYRTEALAEARRDGAPDDLATLDGIIDVDILPWSGFDLTGNWQCRTIKLGGSSGIVVYGWFRCKVTDDGSGWRLQKTTGSQRTTGRFFDEGEKVMTDLGTGSVNEDTPPRYGAGPDSDQVGRAYRTGDQGWRIEFPAPRYESKFDILEFRR